MTIAKLIETLRAKDAAWQKQCDEWIDKAESLGGVDKATIDILRRTVEREAADALASSQEEIERLRAELAEFDETNRMMVRHADIRKAEIKRLRRALEPFAKEAEARAQLVLGQDIDHWPIGGNALTLGDLRRAVRALASQPMPELGGGR